MPHFKLDSGKHFSLESEENTPLATPQGLCTNLKVAPKVAMPRV